MSLKGFPVLGLCVLVAACGSGQMTDLEEFVEEVKAREPEPIEPLPEIKQVDTFVYSPGDRSDPFAMERPAGETEPAAAAGSGIAPDPVRRKEELEQFSLDALRMSGTLRQGDVMWGLVLAPDGTLHRVRVGNYMGQNNGRITRISEEKIELTEIVADGVKTWRERQAAVVLSQ